MGKTVDIDKVYVNTDPAFPANENRPSGSLWDVAVYCLNNNVSPAYIIGGDGVFFLPDTFSAQFKVNTLNTLVVEDLIAAVSAGLEKTLRTEIAKFWAAPAKPIRPDNASLSNKQALIEAYAVVTSAELSLSVMANNFDARLGERFAHLLDAGAGRGAFEVNLQPSQDYLLSRQPCFVLDNAERPHAEMSLVNESTSYLLHTPECGFEFFEKNTDLHRKLQQRLSLNSDQIRYLKATQSPHAFSVETHLKGQLESVASLFSGRGQLEKSLAAMLQENQRLHVLRYGINTRFSLLLAALKRTDWPLWLEAAGSDIQQRYNQLEESKDQYQAAFSSAFDACFSFKDYVLRTFAEWADRVLGEHLDPEAISVHSSYKLQIAGRTIEQEETRTLTEFIVFGLHDNGYKATLTIIGAPDGSRLTTAALEQWLESRNLRLEFTGSLASSASADYQEAYRNYLFSQMEFAVFVARQSGKLDSNDANIISRAMANDPSVTIKGLRISDQVPALKDVLIISAREYVPSLMLVKTPGGEFELLKFSDVYAANRWLETALSADREYAALLIHPDYLHDAGKLLGSDPAQLSYRYTLDGRPVDLGLNLKAPLADYVNIAYRAEVALHKAIAPVGYRALGVEGRKRYSRLTTELKALTTVDARDNGFPTFEQFTYDSVKAQIEDILRNRGSKISVNPDQIIVQTEEFRKSVTDVLLEGLAFEAAHPAYATKFSPKYYLVNGHPIVEKLDIRDLSSLSKTFRPGDRYTAMLKAQYQNKAHPDYAFKRAVHARRIRSEMYCNAFTDFTNGRLSTESFSAIQQVIDNLKESGGYQSIVASVSEGGVGLYKFNIGALGLTAAGDRTVGDVYIFRLKLSAGLLDVLYTPDAPDRVSFRPIADFIPSIRFRYGPFRTYYSGRILLVDQKVINDYFDRLVATVDTRPVIGTQQRSLLPDLFTFHDERVRRVLSDIDERTISLNEIIAGLVYDNLLKAANIVSLLVPPVGTVVVAVQLMKSIYDASQSHRRGDYSAALGHVKDALFGLVTLGKAAAAGAPAKEVTRAQRSFLDLFGDARTVAELVMYYTGHQDPQDELLGFFKSLMEDAGSALSKTTVR
ncbi:dermonecrotic toxin domain-containing protein [Pseudomonas sp. NPDC085632]|uniref:dermonecrotic toxin domain-containing protein n=1 Tax=Pseudomonas sp. NPDC085632 TaxID=3364429 RepID=UPI0037C942AC